MKLNLFVGGSFKDYQNMLKHYTGTEQEHYDDETEGIYSYFPEQELYFMWVKDDKNIAILAHEILHLVFELLHRKGITYCSESEEAFTYDFQWWLETILAKSKKK